MAKKVLVVDDDPVVRILVGECLTAKGYSVSVADGCEECFEYLRETAPDLLILDYLMPGMTGMEILLKIRKEQAFTNLAVIIMSADPETEQVLKENEAKPEAFLTKPVAFEQIIKAVESVLGDIEPS